MQIKAKFCRDCGRNLGEDRNFCSQCGSEIRYIEDTATEPDFFDAYNAAMNARMEQAMAEFRMTHYLFTHPKALLTAIIIGITVCLCFALPLIILYFCE